MATESTFVWKQTFTALSDFSTATTWINAASTVYMAAFGGQFMIVSSSAASGGNPGVTFCVSSTGTGQTGAIGVIQNSPYEPNSLLFPTLNLLASELLHSSLLWQPADHV